MRLPIDFFATQQWIEIVSEKKKREINGRERLGVAENIFSDFVEMIFIHHSFQSLSLFLFLCIGNTKKTKSTFLNIHSKVFVVFIQKKVSWEGEIERKKTDSTLWDLWEENTAMKTAVVQANVSRYELRVFEIQMFIRQSWNDCYENEKRNKTQKTWNGFNRY